MYVGFPAKSTEGALLLLCAWNKSFQPIPKAATKRFLLKGRVVHG